MREGLHISGDLADIRLPVLLMSLYKSRETGIQKTMAAIHEALEEAIRAHPEQWLWTYRRWRTRPKGEQAGPDGLPPRLELHANPASAKAATE